MKAIIMAGGEGSRLRPLTCDLPKPMARLCGKPVLEYIIELLGKHGCLEAAITVQYLPRAISEHFPNGRHGNVELVFVEEDKPLGTAGSVKNACGDGESGVLVISGDAMCDFNLTAAIRYHNDNGADATIIGRQVSDPREYGLIDIRDDGSIAAFIEKPAFSQAISDIANTGIYILSKTALDLIPHGVFFDFAKNLFPLMLTGGMKLMCYEERGYWCDIGDLDAYISCQRDILAGRVACDIKGKRDENGNIFAGEPPSKNCVIVPPVYIGKNVSVEDGAVIDGSVIDDGCHIGEGSRITASVALQSAYISGLASMTGALLCSGASLKAGASMLDGSAVGAGAVIGEHSAVGMGIKIWNQKKIPPSITVSEHVRLSVSQKSFFGEDGISGEIGVDITPEFLARIGAAVGSLKPESRIAVGGSCHPGVKALKDALSAGIQSTGSGVMDFGENFKTRFEFDMGFSSADTGVFIRGGNRASILVMGRGGLPAGRETERGIESLLARGEFTRRSFDRMGDRVEMTGMEMLYKSQLIRCAIKGLSGCSARIHSRGMMVQDTLRDTLFKLGCDIKEGFTLEISSQGEKIRLYDNLLGYIPHHRILSWCAIHEMERGEDIAIPFDAPRFLDAIAKQNNVRLLRYFDCPADSSDREARKIAAFQMWPRDGLMQAVMLLSIIKNEGGLENLMKRLPCSSVSSRVLETGDNPARYIREINNHEAGEVAEGIIINSGKGLALVRPMKRGTGIRVLAEAASVEIADEICADIEKLIARQMKKGE